MVFPDKLALHFNRALMGIGCGILALMVALTCMNILLRTVWGPIQGTYELMGYFGGVLTSFTLGYTQIQRGHISVDIVILRFSDKLRRIVAGINSLVCTIFFSLVAWRIARYAATLCKTGEVTETLRIVYYPFVYGVALGCAALSLVFLTDLVRLCFPGKEETS